MSKQQAVVCDGCGTILGLKTGNLLMSYETKGAARVYQPDACSPACGRKVLQTISLQENRSVLLNRQDKQVEIATSNDATKEAKTDAKKAAGVLEGKISKIEVALAKRSPIEPIPANVHAHGEVEDAPAS